MGTVNIESMCVPVKQCNHGHLCRLGVTISLVITIDMCSFRGASTHSFLLCKYDDRSGYTYDNRKQEIPHLISAEDSDCGHVWPTLTS